jgi:uncharacterized membrane protein
MIGALFGVIAAFSWGGGDFLGGLASRRLPTFLVVAVSQSATLALLIPVALITGGVPPAGTALLTTAVAGIVGGAGVLVLYHGFAHGRISIVASIAGTLSALIPVGVSILQGEIPSLLRLVGFLAAIVAIIIVSTSSVEHAVAGEAGAHADASSGVAARGGAVGRGGASSVHLAACRAHGPCGSRVSRVHGRTAAPGDGRPGRCGR